jgi:anaerobic magnesium-protoporphyrin IX monomethyl ester cyclase
MDILLIYPRWNYPTFGQLQEPLGLLYLAASLRAAGHEVQVIDLAIEDIGQVDAALARVQLVGISSSTVLYGRACLILDRIKAARPELPVVLGGPHATVRPEEVVARGFDAAAIGEGEHTAVELAQALIDHRPLGEVPGLAARAEGGAVFGPVRPFEPDFDALPDADRTRLDYRKYIAANMTHVGMMATRGCPWNCLFCKPMQDKLFGRKVRRRGLARIAAEMAGIARELGKKQYIFKDDTFVLAGREWFVEFERELAGAGLAGVSFSCQARVDQIDLPLVEQMKRCGLEGIAFGVESGSQKVLDYYRKGIKPEQTIRAFDICHEAGIGTHAFIMLGAPVETRADLEATIALIERLRTESVSVSVTTPAPGTALYDRVLEAGLLNVASPEDADYFYNREPIRLPHLTMKDLAWAEKKILDLVPRACFMDQLQSRQQQLAAQG